MVLLNLNPHAVAEIESVITPLIDADPLACPCVQGVSECEACIEHRKPMEYAASGMNLPAESYHSDYCDCVEGDAS